MAAHLSMPVGECMRRHTQRQFLVTLAWLGHDMSRPSKSDHYLMQIAAEGRRAIVKDASAVRVDDFIIKFRNAGDKAATPDPRKVTHSKNMWLSSMVGQVTKVESTRPGS